MQVPKLEKIAINQGVGAALADKKLIDVGIAEMTAITGQKAVATISKRDVSNLRTTVILYLPAFLSGDFECKAEDSPFPSISCLSDWMNALPIIRPQLLPRNHFINKYA